MEYLVTNADDICVLMCVVTAHRERIFFEGLFLTYYLWHKGRRSFFAQENSRNKLEENPLKGMQGINELPVSR